MRFSLKPKDVGFFQLFENSAKHLFDAANVLVQLVEEDDFDQRVVLAFKLTEIEHKADEATHAIIKKLNSTFVTPFDRDNIYKLASEIDDCVDLIEDSAEIIVTYKIAQLPKKTKAMARLLQNAAEITLKVMPRLVKNKEISKFWVEINSIENEADKLFRLIITDLFAEEKDPIKLIKAKDLIENMEKCADTFEHLASTVETISIEES
jgi:predicted phosphate transport protein (TIGR00153 family)